jgi:Putative motility protein
MTAAPIGSGIITSIAAQATILKEAQLQTSVNVAILSDALDFQEELATKLFQSLGIGQNADVIV